jgi:hypothetical protein
LTDFFHFNVDDAEQAAQVTVDVVAQRIPAKFGLNPRRDIQVLTPMHRGAAGASVLNTLLQEALTPASPEVPERRFGGRIFRVGDKVTQIRNNYDKGAHGVLKGTQGVVNTIDPVDQTLTGRTDEDEDIDYDFGQLDELTHAYAVSIHRSQGSEYPCVVIPITTSAWMMLQRNLLYTAITRAKKLVVLVGSKSHQPSRPYRRRRTSPHHPGPPAQPPVTQPPTEQGRRSRDIALEGCGLAQPGAAVTKAGFRRWSLSYARVHHASRTRAITRRASVSPCLLLYRDVAIVQR